MTVQQLARPLAQRVQELPPAVFSSADVTAPDGVLLKAQEALDAGKTHYTDRPGILPLRQNVSALLASTGHALTPDAITITCGLIESRYVALSQLVAHGGTVLTSRRLEDAAAGVCALLGLAHAVSSGDFASVDGVRMIMTQGSDELMSALTVSGNPWIVHEWQPADRITVSPEAAGRVIVIGEFEQLAGWRVGWMAGSSAAGKLRAFKQSMTICTPSISQWAALGIEPKNETVAE